MNLDRPIICLMSFNALNGFSKLFILKVLCISKLYKKFNAANKI